MPVIKAMPVSSEQQQGGGGEHRDGFMSTMKPVLRMLAITGLWNNSRLDEYLEQDHRKRSPVRSVVNHLARTLVFLLLLLNFIRCLTAGLSWFKNNEYPSVSFQFTYAVYFFWDLQMLCISCIYIIASSSKNQFLRVLEFIKANNEVFQVKSATSIRRKAIATSLITLSFGAINTGLISIHILAKLPGFHLSLRLGIEPLPDHPFLVVLVLFVAFFNSLIWATPKGFMFVFCKFMETLFYQLSGDIVNAQESHRFAAKIRSLRDRHNKLCRAVELADKTFNKLIFVTYIFSIPLLCFNLYVLRLAATRESMEPVFVALILFWTFTNVIDNYCMSAFPGELSRSIHSPLNHLYEWQPNWLEQNVLAESREEVIYQMSMFVSKLNGSSMGLTFWNYFVITKEVVLTLLGMFATYFVLLLQFDF